MVPPKLRLTRRRRSNSLTQKIRRGSSPWGSGLAENASHLESLAAKWLSLCGGGAGFCSLQCRCFIGINSIIIVCLSALVNHCRLPDQQTGGWKNQPHTASFKPVDIGIHPPVSTIFD